MKNNPLKLLFLCSQLICVFARAETKCIDLFSKNTKTPQTIEEIKDYQMGLFKRWDSDLGKFAVAHINVEIDPSNNYLNSGYSAPLNTIFLGMPFKNQNIEILALAQAHEYGHAILNSHFVIKLQTEKIELSKLVKKVQKDKKSSAAVEELEFFLSALQPYTEFFSDTVAVLLYRDPKLMSQMNADIRKLEPGPTKTILLAYQKQRPKTAPEARSFESFPFSLWKKKISDPYAIFDPARGVLWNLYIKNLPSSEIPLFLDVLLKSMAEHVQSQYEQGEWPPSRSVPSTQTLDKVNRDFLFIFNENAKKMSLKIRKG